MINPTRPSRWQIGGILFVGILAASTSAIFIRYALEASGTRGVGFSLVLAAARLTLASLLLLPAWKNFHATPVPRRALYQSIAAGVFLAIHFAAWITSLSYTSIAASTALVTTNPVWVALISWVWLKEKPSVVTGGGIAIALLGGILVAIGDAGSLSSAPQPWLGNVLALVGSWAVSFYFLLGRAAQQKGLGIGRHAVLAYSIAALVLMPLPTLFQTSYLGYPPTVYLCILLMALFPQLIGHTSFNWAVRWTSPTLVTLVILAEPVGSSLLAFLLFQENPGVSVFLGAAVILLGVGVAAWGQRSA